MFGDRHQSLAETLYVGNWRAGYIREARYATNEIDSLAELCRAPAATLMRALSLAIPASRLGPAIDLLANSVFVDTLHELTISNVHVDPPMLDPAMPSALRRLRHLALRGACVRPGQVAHISSLVLAPTSYDLEHLGSMVRDVSFTAVTELVVDLANLAEPVLPISMVEQLLGATFVPRLERFAVRRATVPLAREIVDVLARSPLQPQLRRVELGPKARPFEHVELTVPADY